MGAGRMSCAWACCVVSLGLFCVVSAADGALLIALVGQDFRRGRYGSFGRLALGPCFRRDDGGFRRGCYGSFGRLALGPCVRRDDGGFRRGCGGSFGCLALGPCFRRDDGYGWGCA